MELGGYICGAVIFEAHRLKIPTVLHESNSFPGKAVKMLAKSTDVIMVGFEDAIKRIPNAKKVILTGTPTRRLEKDLSLSEKIALKEKYKLNPAKPTVLVFGGSQGARVLNETIVELSKLKLNKNYEVLLVAGQKQYEEVKKSLSENKQDIENLDGIRVVPYIYELAEVISSSEIVVSRSGAITITEIANIGKPSILVPLPNVSHNHQQYNAEVLENAKAAKIIKNDELNATLLNKEIMDILSMGKLEEMGSNAKKIALNNVEDKIYEEINNLVKEKNG